MKEYKVGDKVVCILKESPDYFVDGGRMDYMLDRKAVLEVVRVDETGVWVSDKVKKGTYWVLGNEDIELYEEPTKAPYKVGDIDELGRMDYMLDKKAAELITLIDKVKEWSIERNIDKANPKEQTLKLLEETGELASALLKSNNDLIIDSLGDILVVLIILHQQLGLTMEQTLSYAYEEIKDRKGKTIGGVFVKDSDL